MQILLEIITITKDDLEGVTATIDSTRKLRACQGVRQIIIDGSDALTRKEIQALVSGEENIDYLWQEPKGISHAFNQGISSSKSEWVWFLNGRDEAHPDLDVHFLLQILKYSQAEVIICEFEFLQLRLPYRHPPLWALWPPFYWEPQPATLVKRGLFDKYGLFSQEFKVSMDSDIWVRFFSKDIVIDMLSMPITLFDQGGVSSSESAKVHQEVNKIIINNFKLLFKIWLKQGFYLLQALKKYIFSKISGDGSTD
jgi:hypothetical protein